jgi:ComF family protein
MAWLQPQSQLLSIVFPNRCIACSTLTPQRSTPFCAVCNPSLIGPLICCFRCGIPITDWINEHTPVCGRCMVRRVHPIEQSWWAFEYGGAVEQALQRLKYAKDWCIARPLGSLWRPPKSSVGDKVLWDALCPVPLHWHRRIQRGFNQATLIAHVIAKRLDLPLLVNGLFRTRSTSSQVRLRAQERALNVQNAFQVRHPRAIQGLRILLIDDVVTTGATVRACARALRRCGAASVSVWSVARRL